MKKIFMVLAALFLLAFVACSSGGGGSSNSSSDTSSAKSITAFSLNGVAGTINEAAKTIAITMPTGTDVTALVATFTTNGTSVKVGSTAQVNGTTTNNFTSSVVYTVTAGDATTQDYTVTVTASGNTTYDVSGTVSGAVVSGVTITLTGGIGSGTATTDSSGNYGFTGIANNDTCTITPSRAGYTFSPISRSITVNNANVTGLNFTATATTFTQDDLTGKWNVMFFQTGTSPGWERGTISIDSNGNITYLAYANSLGTVMESDSYDPHIRVTINSSGIVTESRPLKSHCYMSADKKTIVCSETDDTDSTAYGTRVCVKTTGVTFSNDDLTGPLSFNFHGIYSGGNSAAKREWDYASGTINASRQVTFNTYQEPAGPGSVPLANSYYYSVRADGFVTATPPNDGRWLGMLSSDKKMMVITARDGDSPERYGFAILTIADQTFAGTSDLAGNWKINGLWGGNGFGWMFGTAAINSSGVASMTSYINSYGDTALPSMGTLALNSSGILTASGTTFHGVLSHNRIVSVVTESTGNYGIDIWMR